MRKAAFILCFLALILPARRAAAVEDVPGDSCAGIPTNSWRWAGAPENGGVVNGLFCNTNWKGVINFQSSGKVGIGTTAPTAQLHVLNTVSGGTGVLGVDNTGAAIGVYGLTTSTTASAVGVLGYAFGSTGAVYGVYGRADSTTGGALGVLALETAATGGTYGLFAENRSSTGYAGYFNNTNGGYAAVFMGGNVGIGTSSPTAALHVVGDIKYTGIIADVSDRRVKNNIRPLSSQLEKVTQLQAVSFIMNDDPKHSTELGLIAQDVEPLFPDLVRTDPDGMKSMNYVGLIAPMIEAIKEQQAEIVEDRAALAAMLGLIAFAWFRPRRPK